jgi:hypothetical protein
MGGTKTRTRRRQTAILLSQDCCIDSTYLSPISSTIQYLRPPPLAETAEAGDFREVIGNFLFETCSAVATRIAIKSTKTVTDKSGASRQQNVKDVYIVCSRRCGGRCSSEPADVTAFARSTRRLPLDSCKPQVDMGLFSLTRLWLGGSNTLSDEILQTPWKLLRCIQYSGIP